MDNGLVSGESRIMGSFAAPRVDLFNGGVFTRDAPGLGLNRGVLAADHRRPVVFWKWIWITNTSDSRPSTTRRSRLGIVTPVATYGTSGLSRLCKSIIVYTCDLTTDRLLSVPVRDLRYYMGGREGMFRKTIWVEERLATLPSIGKEEDRRKESRGQARQCLVHRKCNIARRNIDADEAMVGSSMLLVNFGHLAWNVLHLTVLSRRHWPSFVFL
ncbi:hypothetical protein LY76DRAFT_392018 [Colletotrichum caudatum]|nr:hypothetical protein LY76DRAFT_392018 [Colletotrichum caudatum]